MPFGVRVNAVNDVTAEALLSAGFMAEGSVITGVVMAIMIVMAVMIVMVGIVPEAASKPVSLSPYL